MNACLWRFLITHRLASVRRVDRIYVLTRSALRTPGVRIAKDGGVIPADRYVSKSTLGYADLGDVVDPVKVVRFFRSGATIVLGTVNLLLPHLHALCKDIETDLGHPVDANIYVAPPHARAFEVHCDAQDIIIIQIPPAAGSRRDVSPPGERTDEGRRYIRCGGRGAQNRGHAGQAGPLHDRTMIDGGGAMRRTCLQVHHCFTRSACRRSSVPGVVGSPAWRGFGKQRANGGVHRRA
jgi:hypothetical protein